MMRRLLLAACLLAGLSLPAGARDIAHLVIGPPGPAALRDLFAHPDQWPRARALTGELLYADHNLRDFSDDELRAWFAAMRAWNMALELEVGAVKEWGPTAEATFRAEQPIWDRVLRLGGPLASVAMDEPLTATRAMLHLPDAYAVTQTARFVQLARRRYPDLRVGDIEPYPAIPLADHVAWLAQLSQALREQGTAPLDFYRLDVDWVAFTAAHRGSWAEVATLADRLGAANLRFSLIYWASPYPSEKRRGLATETTWYDEVMAQAATVRAAGIRPAQFVLESWIATPARTVPEADPTSFTHSVRDFGQRYLAPAE